MTTRYTLLLTCLCLGCTNLAPQSQESQRATVTETLARYVAAVQSRRVPEAEKHVVATEAFVMVEDGHVNSGWADYRDHHLLPHLKDFKEFRFNIKDVKPLVSGDMAYATFKYDIAVIMEKGEFEGEGFGTAVLVGTTEGWKIQHMHTSSIPKKKQEKGKNQ